MPLATTETDCPFRCTAGSSLVPRAECGREPLPPFDGGPPPPDASIDPLDASVLTCPVDRASATCLDGFVVQPGRPFDLPVTFDGCGCCPQTECVVESARDSTLHLTTARCPDECDCDTCSPIQATCRVPALAAGLWNVVVNRESAFELPVFPESGRPLPSCASYAQADMCGLSGPPTYQPSSPDRLCVSRRSFIPGEVLLDLEWACPSCFRLNGPCLASVEPRTTTDLPPGGEIVLAVDEHQTICDGFCLPGCAPQTQSCFVPPLVPGGYYRVWHEGVLVLDFVEGATASPVCADLGIVPG